MRTLRADEAGGVCSGMGGGVVDSSGEIERAGDSSGAVKGVGVGDSCAAATEAKIANRNAARLLLFREFREIPPDLRIKVRLGTRLRSVSPDGYKSA